MVFIKTQLRKHSGMTLTEILVATMLVAIVMLGALSVDYAVRNARKSASQDSSLSIRSQATMLQISRDANMAVGDSSNLGIVTTPNYLCIRTELGGDINSYSDDQWVCYWQSSKNIHRCTKDVATGGVPGICMTGDTVVGTACLTAGCFTHNFVTDQATGQLYLDISLTNRVVPNSNAHPINNPEYTASTRIYPSGHGF